MMMVRSARWSKIFRAGRNPASAPATTGLAHFGRGLLRALIISCRADPLVIDKRRGCGNLHALVVASVAQLVEQLTLNFAQCFQWFYHGLLFRDFSLFRRTIVAGQSALRVVW
jgi:hypothetical protein